MSLEPFVVRGELRYVQYMGKFGTPKQIIQTNVATLYSDGPCNYHNV